MRPCPEFYGSDARRTPAAAPQLLTPLCRTRVDQRARAARASRTRLPRRNARRSGASHRARFSLARRAPAVRTPFVAGVEAHLALRAKRERPIAALRFPSSSDSGLSKTPIRPPETLAFLPNRARSSAPPRWGRALRAWGGRWRGWRPGAWGSTRGLAGRDCPPPPRRWR